MYSERAKGSNYKGEQVGIAKLKQLLSISVANCANCQFTKTRCNLLHVSSVKC